MCERAIYFGAKRKPSKRKTIATPITRGMNNK